MVNPACRLARTRTAFSKSLHRSRSRRNAALKSAGSGTSTGASVMAADDTRRNARKHSVTTAGVVGVVGFRRWATREMDARLAPPRHELQPFGQGDVVLFHPTPQLFGVAKDGATGRRQYATPLEGRFHDLLMKIDVARLELFTRIGDRFDECREVARAYEARFRRRTTVVVARDRRHAKQSHPGYGNVARHCVTTQPEVCTDSTP